MSVRTKKSKLKQLAGITLALVTWVSAVHSQEIQWRGRHFVSEFAHRFRMDPGGQLKIYDVRGDIWVRTWDKNEVRVRERVKMEVYDDREARAVLEELQSARRHRGPLLEIGGAPYRQRGVYVDFQVTTPRQFNVELETSGGELDVSDLTGKATLSTSGGDLKLSNIDGEIEARTSGGDVRVRGATGRTEVRTSGGDIYLVRIGGPVEAKTSGGNVVVRGADAEVDVRTSGGDIEVRDTGGRVKASTSGGDIEVVNARGSVSVHTSGGDIELENVRGPVEATTSGGDIEGRDIGGAAEVRTSGGSIELLRVNGGVRARTSGGDVTVEVTLEDFSKEHEITLRSSGGDLRLIIPEKLPATIQAKIDVRSPWEDFRIYSDFPLTSSEENGGERRRRRRYTILSEGEINGGGDFIVLSTVNGNIYIKKLERD